MSEKRFMRSWNMHRGVHYYAIEDTQEKKMYCVEQSIEDVEKVADLLNEQQSTINKLEQRDYYNQSERYKILGRAIELASDYIHRNDLEYYDFCGLVTELEKELLDNGR